MEVKHTRNKSVDEGLEALIAGGSLIGKIGWTASDINVDPETGETQLVAESAIENEFGYLKIIGNSAIHIPSRPFLRNTIRRESASWLNTIEDEAKKVLENKILFDKVLYVVTEEAIEAVRDTVRNRIAPPLAAVTLEKRNIYVRGVGIPTGTLPLYNTGHMMQTLTNEVIPE